MVVALDWNIVYLRLAAVIAPLIFGAAFSWFGGRGAGAACSFALALGLVAAAGMTVSESLATGDPMLPQSRLEWLDNVQFAASMALSFVAGYFAASVRAQTLAGDFAGLERRRTIRWMAARRPCRKCCRGVALGAQRRLQIGHSS